MIDQGEKSRRWRYQGALGAVLLLVFCAVIVWDGVAEFFGVLPLKPRFGDLVAILAAGEAHQAGLNVYLPNPLDPMQRPHVYGPWWLVTGKMGLVRADLLWLGPALIGGFVWSAVRVLAPRSWRTFLWSTALLVSPPFLLGMERANNDLIIFLILMVAANLLTRKSWWSVMGGSGALIIAAALKLYPVVALAAVLGRSGKKRHLVFLLGIVGLVSVACYMVSIEDYRATAAIAPEPLSIFATGIKLSYLLVKFAPGTRTWLILGAAISLGMAGFWIFRARAQIMGLFELSGYKTTLCIACATCTVFCYFATISYPYRLVLFLPLIAAWLEEWAHDASQSRWALMPLILCAVVFWATCVKFNFMASREGIFSGAPWLWVFVGVEHACMFALSIILLLSLFGWFTRWMKYPDSVREISRGI